ncbi:E3 ubiquitin-protein ligase TRIM33-like isoform X2 [Acanthaster planci]|uniref:E3 ubiquitin-protein ligase TRIM33-like isoform X2 n=1 Tax=Acanthaster planci TaxID=133434 RepID=A0A8B7YUP8_ACAPL|nr:E3 ubiquitin-protein ligase TRIM33-like isoform X2 [Acanthaster planci]
MGEPTRPALSVLDQVSQDYLQCPMCKHLVEEPKLLDCLHHFCLKCLKALREQHKASIPKLPCPSCKQDCHVSDIDELPHYFTLGALVEEAKLQEQLKVKGQGSGITCQACDESSDAMSRCFDCDSFLCHQCEKAHSRLSMTKSHKICSLDELRSGEVIYKSRQREHVPKCKKHLDQTLTLYCCPCQQMICSTCFIEDHKSSEHSLTDLFQASDKTKKDISKTAVATELITKRFRDAAEKAQESLKKIKAEFAETNSKIAMKADTEVAKIRQEEKKLKQELKKIYQDRVKRLETVQAANMNEAANVERMLDRVNKLTAQASCYEIINFGKKLLMSLNDLQTMSKKPAKAPDEPHFVDFKELEGVLGKLILEEESRPGSEYQAFQAGGLLQPHKIAGEEHWKLETQIKKFGVQKTKFQCAYDVTALSSHEIVIVDIKLQQLIKCFCWPSQSASLQQATPIPDLTDPSHVSRTMQDQLIILDGPTVKIFSREGELLDQFMPDGGVNSKLTCLAVDGDGRIAVGYKYNEKVCLHETDGTLIKKLPAPMIGEHLTIYKRRLIYTNHGYRMLRAVDYDGAAAFSVDIISDIDSDWGPTGVCCDHDGCIYVAVNGWSYSEVQRFSSEGEFQGQILDTCGFPWGITLSPDSNSLVVAAHNCVAVFNRTEMGNGPKPN